MKLKLKNIKFPKTYTELLQWVCYLWAGTICFPALQGTFYGVFVLLLWGVFRGHIGLSFLNKNKKHPLGILRGRKTPFYFLLAYLLWMTATIFWSDDIREYFRQFEKLIPLYLLAFIGFMNGIDKHVNFNKVLNAFLWGVVICIAYMVVLMGVDMFVGDIIGRIKTAGIMSLDLLTPINHRTYIGATLLMAIPLLMMNIKSQTRWQQISTIIFVLFIDLLCIMSSARILMGLSVLVTLYAFYYVWGQQVKWWMQIMALVLVLGVSSVVILQNQRIQQKISQLQQGADIEDVESRTYLWKCATELIKEKPLCGYGMGDAEDALLGKYQEDRKWEAFNRKFNSHNQYLQTCLQGGIIAIFLSVIFIILLLINSKNSWFLWISMVLIFGSALIFEAMLIRNSAIFTVIFFILSYNNKIEIFQSKPKRIVIDITLILFICIFLISKIFPLNSNNPRSYMTGEYEICNWKDLPNNEDLPNNIKGFSVSTDYIKQTKDKYFIFSKLLVDNFNRKQPSDVQFSIWCYVPQSTKCNTVKVLIDNSSKKHSTTYNFAKKGTWQHLKIDMNETLRLSMFYFVIVIPREEEFEDGKIYFVSPQITIDGVDFLR